MKKKCYYLIKESYLTGLAPYLARYAVLDVATNFEVVEPRKKKRRSSREWRNPIGCRSQCCILIGCRGFHIKKLRRRSNQSHQTVEQFRDVHVRGLDPNLCVGICALISFSLYNSL